MKLLLLLMILILILLFDHTAMQDQEQEEEGHLAKETLSAWMLLGTIETSRRLAAHALGKRPTPSA